jgi:hypothetical protein
MAVKRYNGTAWVTEAGGQAAQSSSNTANALVLRDGSGNFSAGAITATTVNATTDLQFNGSSITGAWQTWAPTLSGGWLNGNGVWTARYNQIGKTVNFLAIFIVGSTTTKGAGIAVSLPVTAQSSSGFMANAYFTQGVTRITAFPLANATSCVLGVSVATTSYSSYGAASATVPFTWATGDGIYFFGTYEAA